MLKYMLKYMLINICLNTSLYISTHRKLNLCDNLKILFPIVHLILLGTVIWFALQIIGNI